MHAIFSGQLESHSSLAESAPREGRPAQHACLDDPDVLRVLNLYRSVPASYRRLLPMEAFCHAAAVSPQVVLANIAAGAVRMNASAAAIVAAAWHPQVVLKTVERGLQDDGVKERMVLHRAAGFIPHCGGWK